MKLKLCLNRTWNYFFVLDETETFLVRSILGKSCYFEIKILIEEFSYGDYNIQTDQCSMIEFECLTEFDVKTINHDLAEYLI